MLEPLHDLEAEAVAQADEAGPLSDELDLELRPAKHFIGASHVEQVHLVIDRNADDHVAPPA